MVGRSCATVECRFSRVERGTGALAKSTGVCGAGRVGEDAKGHDTKVWDHWI